MAGKKRPTDWQDAFANTGAGDPMPEVRAQLVARSQARRKARRGKRPRMTYDLPARMIEMVKAVADKEQCAQSDLVALALADWLADYEAGQVDLEPLKVNAKSLRFVYHLELPVGWE